MNMPSWYTLADIYEIDHEIVGMMNILHACDALDVLV